MPRYYSVVKFLAWGSEIIGFLKDITNRGLSL